MKLKYANLFTDRRHHTSLLDFLYFRIFLDEKTGQDDGAEARVRRGHDRARDRQAAQQKSYGQEAQPGPVGGLGPPT